MSGQAVKDANTGSGSARPVRNGTRDARCRWLRKSVRIRRTAARGVFRKTKIAAPDKGHRGVCRGTAMGPAWTGQRRAAPGYGRNAYPIGVRIGGGGGNLLIYKAFSASKRFRVKRDERRMRQALAEVNSCPRGYASPKSEEKLPNTIPAVKTKINLHRTDSLSAENHSQSAS